VATPTQIKRRGRLSLILGATIAAALFVAVSWADVISNNDVVTGGDTSLARGSSSQAHIFVAAPTGAPDAPGCNATGSDPATAAVTVTAGGTSSETKPLVGCGSANFADVAYSVQTTAVLGTVITVTSNVSGGKPGSVYTQDSFTVRVLPRAASNLSATANGANAIDLSWTASPDAADITDYKIYEGATEVPTAAKNVTTKSITGLAPGSSHCYTIKARYNDGTNDYFSAAAGGSGAACATTASDSTPPVITPNVSGTLGNNGWYTSNVTVSWSVTDGESAISSSTGCGSTTISTDTSGTTLTCSATSAGGTTSESVTIKRDATNPSISVSHTANAAGWNSTSPVSLSITASDALSLLAGPPTCTDNGTALPVSGASSPYSASVSGPGTHNVSCSASDNAGNSESANDEVKIDTSAPVVTPNVTGTLGNNGWYRSNVGVSWLVSDPESDIASSTGCGATTITSDTAGQTLTCSATNNAGLSNSVSVTIKRDASAPSISVESVKNAGGSLYTPGTWSNQDVTVTFACTDNGPSGVDSYTAPVTKGEGENQTASGTCTDNAGNTDSTSVSDIDVDKTKPVIGKSATANSAPYAAGTWTKYDVVVSFTCADAGSVQSGIATDTVAGQTLTAEGADQSVTNTGVCVDNAGNAAAAATFSDIDIDKTKPVIGKSATANGVAYTSGTWTKYDVVVSFTCGDTGPVQSGIATDTVAGDTVTTEGDNQSVTNTGSCVDNAGNPAESETFSGIKIDKTPPGLAWNSGISDGDSFYFGFVPAAPTCTASDSLSGPDGCNVSGYSTAVGPHTLTATAKDKAGNQTVETRGYTVLAWTLNGFYSPVDMTPPSSPTVWNTVKNGSTVPLKFEVFAGPTELTDTAIVNQPLKATQTLCSGGTTDDIELTATGGTVLRYDGTGGQFIYNWQTPKKPGYCYEVTVTTLDGSFLKAYFKLK
jgi:hypothetical protein